MNRSLLLTLVLVSLFAAVTYAAWFDNANGTSTESTVDVSAPFPGTDWLQRFGTPATAYTSKDGVDYTSVWDAVLYGAPEKYPCRNMNTFVNSILLPHDVALWVVDKGCGGSLEWAHYALCYLRNFVGCILTYFGFSLFFHYHCYVHPRSKDIFAHRPRPTWDTIWDQIKFAAMGMPVYTGLPVLDEWVVEEGYTKVYYTVNEIGGWIPSIAYFVLYFALVEIGIYWMHRTLHTNKWLYKNVHMPHHKYNKAETLSPWASIAFHPLDGMMQAAPYVLLMPVIPVHYGVHFLLLFFTPIWSTYIHDAMEWNPVEFIMGSRYHTVHHTHYIYNYGQVFTFCDRYWGTFKEPDGPLGVPKKNRQKAS